MPEIPEKLTSDSGSHRASKTAFRKAKRRNRCGHKCCSAGALREHREKVQKEPPDAHFERLEWTTQLEANITPKQSQGKNV